MPENKNYAKQIMNQELPTPRPKHPDLPVGGPEM